MDRASQHSRRSAISDTAWSAQDKLRSGSGRAAKATGGAVGSSFERAGYTLRKRLLWPLQDRFESLGRPARALTAAAAVLLVAAAAVGALQLASSGGSGEPSGTRVAATTGKRVTLAAAAPKQAPEPTLEGAAPVFKAGPGGVAAGEPDPSKAVIGSSPAASDAAPTSSEAAADDTESAATEATGDAAETSTARLGTTAAKGPPAGPQALAVAEEFADAFVLYETGGVDGKVRRVFGATATEQLSKALLDRPPSLPANVKVPRAKVLNVVAAPSRARVFPVSVSLLRVGVTSELRIDMEKLKGDGWRVTNVLG